MGLGDLAAELEELIAKGATEANVPGMSVGLVHGDEELVVSYGVTNVEHPLDVDRRTLFQIGSTTKTFTATAIMRLVEQGLSLDDTVVSLIPEFRLARDGEGEQLTIRHLLTHAGGWSGDWFLLTEPDYGREGALARVVGDMWQAPRLLPPGTGFSYNNAGFYVLGRLLEVITGDPYPDAVRKLVLEPVGLDHSFFYADDMITHRVSAGHVAGDDGPKVFRPWPRPFYAWPAGALCSCTDDQLAWAKFWFGDGGDVLKAETMAAMTTPQMAMSPRSWIGLAWMVRDEGGHRIVEHGGATNGFLSELSTVPAERFAVSILSNATASAALNRRLEKWAFQRVLGIVESGPTRIDADEAALAPLAGRYGLGADATWAHEIVLEDGLLTLIGGSPEPSEAPPPRYRLAVCDGDEVVCIEPEAAAGVTGQFGRDDEGEIAWVRFGLRIYTRL
jgi:CubicO group peptidase (beta-lactamase class C family)